MIAATELRLGNYVIVDNHKYHPDLKDIPLKVISVSDSRNNQHSIGLNLIFKDKPPFYGTYAQWDKYIIGIPLTEQWLFDFGFKYNGWNYDFEIYRFHAQGRNGEEFYNTEFYIKRGTEHVLISFNIKTVHQLQNIYFALTGKELGLNKGK
jgi:hypothetical protein